MHATKNGGKFDLTLQARSTEGKSIENVLLVLPMAKSVTSVNATCNVGGYMFDPVSKVGVRNKRERWRDIMDEIYRTE